MKGGVWRPRLGYSPAPMTVRLLAFLILCLSLGCASTPVRIERADPRDVQREITANVLSTGEISPRSMQVLERLSLRDAYEKQPVATLSVLHGQLATEGDHRRLSTLAELCFHHAERTRDRAYYLLSAVYAYALLFPGPGGETLDASDPRVRLAYDLYNRALTESLTNDRGGIEFRAGRHPLPIGSVEIALQEGETLWAGHQMSDFIAAADYEVKGIRNRYRRPGLGAPIAAALGAAVGPDATPSERFMPGFRVPVTAVLRIEDPRHALKQGRLMTRLELYTPDESATVSIDGHDVPVEFETTSSLANALADSPFWDFELGGFFSGAVRPFREAVTGTDLVDEPSRDEGLLFLAPYRPGLIPLVLVHGTASSPGRWADLVNELENERVIAGRYQIWLFLYNTGNPIGYSGGLLRRALENAVADLDPEGRDPALRQMVVAGHSQGGLLTKLTAIESGDHFWHEFSETPLDELELQPSVRETLRSSTYFEPEPFVKRVIFVCTPHRGSYLAGLSLASFSPAQWVGSLVALPSNLTQVFAELVTNNQGKLLLRNMNRLPTSIDNMTPGNPFIRTLSEISVAPGIAAHSIIAVNGDGPRERGSDGVVAYESAHIDGVESEFVVNSSHSAQGLPETIEEIRRILLVHAAANPPQHSAERSPRYGSGSNEADLMPSDQSWNLIAD